MRLPFILLLALLLSFNIFATPPSPCSFCNSTNTANTTRTFVDANRGYLPSCAFSCLIAGPLYFWCLSACPQVNDCTTYGCPSGYSCTCPSNLCKAESTTSCAAGQKCVQSVTLTESCSGGNCSGSASCQSCAIGESCPTCPSNTPYWGGSACGSCTQDTHCAAGQKCLKECQCQNYSFESGLSPWTTDYAYIGMDGSGNHWVWLVKASCPYMACSYNSAYIENEINGSLQSGSIWLSNQKNVIVTYTYMDGTYDTQTINGGYSTTWSQFPLSGFNPNKMISKIRFTRDPAYDGTYPNSYPPTFLDNISLVPTPNHCVSCSAGETCSSCPSGTPYWSGTACVNCTSDSHCPLSQQCNTNTHICCSSTTPYWNGAACVQCLSSSNCSVGQQCVSNSCTACTVGEPCPSCESPNTIWDGAECVQCVRDSQCAVGQKCPTTNVICRNCDFETGALTPWTTDYAGIDTRLRAESCPLSGDYGVELLRYNPTPHHTTHPHTSSKR